MTPRLSSNTLLPEGIANILITVPFSEAVARREPEELKARAARGESWAGIMVTASRFSVSNICTSPICPVEKSKFELLTLHL